MDVRLISPPEDVMADQEAEVKVIRYLDELAKKASARWTEYMQSPEVQDWLKRNWWCDYENGEKVVRCPWCGRKIVAEDIPHTAYWCDWCQRLFTEDPDE